jgi:putative ABC transport system ATP-binding protein
MHTQERVQQAREIARAEEGTALVATDLRMEYKTVAGPFPALTGVSMSVGSGELVAIVGRSGSGKSTLLNLVAGIDRPTQGTVCLAGTVLADLDERRLSRFRGTHIGVVFQFFQLLPTLTTAENVILPMDLCHSVPVRDRRPRALELLEAVGIADQADKLPATLSGGQQQRAAIARALANDPPLIVADEPTGNLDTHTSDEILRLFRDLADSGKAVLMVTHERDISHVASRIVELRDGRVISDARALAGGPAR